jgi:hypothetical protein
MGIYVFVRSYFWAFLSCVGESWVGQGACGVCALVGTENRTYILREACLVMFSAVKGSDEIANREGC